MNQPFLFPAPRELRMAKGRVNLANAEWIYIAPEFTANLKRHGAALADTVQHLFPLRIGVTSGSPERGRMLLSVARSDSGVPAQGYRMSVDEEGIAIEAADERGAFYALKTAQQLLSQYGHTVPVCGIADHPDFTSRGVMLDISRCKVPTMKTLFRLADQLAAFKINQIQLYTEHTYAFSAHESVWHDASPLTSAEILEFDAYCADRYIELVPNLNSFGHMERWLRYPSYRYLAECPDGFDYPWGGRSPWGSTLKPDRESLSFLDTLYGEMLPNFASRFFNVGCDETWELGQGWSKPHCERRGTHRVYLDFVKGIQKLTAKHNRTMMFWGDIILKQPALIRELPKNVVALNWGYEADHPFGKECRAFAGSKVPFYVCPGTSSWNSLTGRVPNCLANCQNAAENGLKHGAVGYLNTDWGDGGHHQYLPISWPGFCAGAAYSWSYKANASVDIVAALNRYVFDDATGLTGRLLFDMGSAYATIPLKTPNKTIFNEMLFCSPAEAVQRRQNVGSSLFRTCYKAFDRIRECIADCRPGCDDGVLVKEELSNAVDMASHSIRRLFAGLDKAPGRASLRIEMRHIIGRHEELWLSRNRPGGLNESSGRLRNSLKFLE